MGFNSENQPKERKPRGPGKKTLMLNAIRATVEGGEQELLQRVVEMATDKEKPDIRLLTEVLQRIEPPLKSTMPMVSFDFDPDSTPSEQAAQVMTAVAAGELQPDIASMFITSITSMLKIEEVTVLAKRLEEVEKALGINV